MPVSQSVRLSCEAQSPHAAALTSPPPRSSLQDRIAAIRNCEAVVAADASRPTATSDADAAVVAIRNAGVSDAAANNAAVVHVPSSNACWRPPTPVALNHAAEANLLAILTAPLLIGESALRGYQRKEHQLVAILANLSVGEARSLHQRLSRPAVADDLLASKFAALIHERRGRLLAFIADTRRRAAIAQARTR